MTVPDGRFDRRFEELIPAWLLTVRHPALRAVVAVVGAAVFSIPLLAFEDAPEVRLGPFLVLGLVGVAATSGWVASSFTGAVLFVGYWYLGVPARSSFAVDDGRDVLAIVSMGVFCVGVAALVRQIEQVISDVRRLDVERQALVSAEAAKLETVEEDRHHLERLVQISTALAAARTPTEVAEAVLDKLDIPARPATASVAVVEDGHLRFLAARNANPESLAALEAVELRASSWLSEVLAGDAALVEDRDEFAAAHPHEGVLRLYPTGSWAVIPFHSNETVGLLSLHFLQRQPLESLRGTYAFVAELLANAIERAVAEHRQAEQLLELEGAFAERDRIARTLSTTLLPPTLPHLPGFEASAWLVPASDDQVAGDFYDLFPVGDGDWVAVLGDVCGKGAEAAAVTSLARYAARATALHDPDPSHIADIANTALVSDSSDLYCTMVIASYRAGAGELSVTLAGHHQARLISGGQVRRVGTFHSPLGYGTQPAPVVRVPFGPGDAVVVFTDGLIERDPRFGEDELDAFLQRGGTAKELAQALLERAAALDAVRKDDIAVLVVSRAVPG